MSWYCLLPKLVHLRLERAGALRVLFITATPARFCNRSSRWVSLLLQQAQTEWQQTKKWNYMNGGICRQIFSNSTQQSCSLPSLGNNVLYMRFPGKVVINYGVLSGSILGHRIVFSIYTDCRIKDEAQTALNLKHSCQIGKPHCIIRNRIS